MSRSGDASVLEVLDGRGLRITYIGWTSKQCLNNCPSPEKAVAADSACLWMVMQCGERMVVGGVHGLLTLLRIPRSSCCWATRTTPPFRPYLQ